MDSIKDRLQLKGQFTQFTIIVLLCYLQKFWRSCIHYHTMKVKTISPLQWHLCFIQTNKDKKHNDTITEDPLELESCDAVSESRETDFKFTDEGILGGLTQFSKLLAIYFLVTVRTLVIYVCK